MDKEIAAKLMALAVVTDQPIAEMFQVIELIGDCEMKECFKKAVGDLMGAVFREIILPIETLFPDLNPEK